MITKEFARSFANEWIAAWNAHDLDRILSHYADDFEMSSPFVVKIANEPSGTLKGKKTVEAYWRRSLERVPDLHFELLEALTGVDSICAIYKSVLGLRAVEWFWFNEAGRVKKAMAHYDDFEGVVKG